MAYFFGPPLGHFGGGTRSRQQSGIKEVMNGSYVTRYGFFFRLYVVHCLKTALCGNNARQSNFYNKTFFSEILRPTLHKKMEMSATLKKE